ncbi:hypothetical protein, partial [Amycolatopsis magusensis]
MASTNKKMLTAPVKPHIFKMLVRDYGYEGVLEINQRFMFVHTNQERWKEYFQQPKENMVPVVFLMPRPNEKKVYSIIRGFERQFRENMHLYIYAQVLAGKSALEAMRTYLAT